MAFDGRATDKRRIQDSDGSNMAVNDIGAIIASPDLQERVAQDVEYSFYHEWSSVTAGSTVTITIVTNSKFPHGTFSIKSDNAARAVLTLSSTTDTTLINGTQDYQFNLNRGANHNRSVASFYYDDTSVSTSGYLFKTISVGRSADGKFASASDLTCFDWLFDDYRIYNLTITNNGADAAWILFRYKYHEHEPTSVDIASGSGEGETEYDGELIV